MPKKRAKALKYTAALAGSLLVLIVAGTYWLNLNARSQDGEMALHWATTEGHAAIAKVLIEAGSDENARDGGGETLLHGVAKAGYTDIVKVLIVDDSDVNARADDGIMPLHLAVANGHADTAKVLIAAGG